jgi:hypothetical protein
MEADAGVDPFQATDFKVMEPVVDSWGQQLVGIETPIDVLQARLSGLIRREGALFEKGVTCSLKDNPEMSCIACPFSKAESPELEGECQLCRIGVGQERLSTLILAKHHGGH